MDGKEILLLGLGIQSPWQMPGARREAGRYPVGPEGQLVNSSVRAGGTDSGTRDAGQRGGGYRLDYGQAPVTDRRVLSGQGGGGFALGGAQAIGLDETASKRDQRSVTVFIDVECRAEPLAFKTWGMAMWRSRHSGRLCSRTMAVPSISCRWSPTYPAPFSAQCRSSYRMRRSPWLVPHRTDIPPCIG